MPLLPSLAKRLWHTEIDLTSFGALREIRPRRDYPVATGADGTRAVPSPSSESSPLAGELFGVLNRHISTVAYSSTGRLVPAYPPAMGVCG